MNLRPLLILLVLTVLPALLGGCSDDAQRSRLQKRADAYFKSGDYDRAELEYKNLLRLDRNNQAAVRNLAVMAFDQGQVLRAYFYLSMARTNFPADREVHAKLAQTLFLTGSLREARREAIAVLADQPTHLEGLVLLLDTTLTTNDVADTEQRLAGLKAAGESAPTYQLALSSWALRRRDTNAALQAIERALALDSNSAPVQMGWANHLAFRRDTNNALAAFKRATELAPPRSAYPLRYADYLLLTGNPAEARQVLERTTKATPDYIPALMRSAQLSLSEGRFAECEAALKSVLNRDQLNYEAILLMSRLRLAQKDPDKAVTELERLVELFPRMPQAHYQLANAHLQRGDVASATRSLDLAVTHQPDYPEAVLLLAELNIRQSKVPLAIAALTKLVQQRPNLAQAQLLLATAYRASRQPDQALKIYENFGRYNPSNPQPAYLIGQVHLERKSPAEARQSFERTLAIEPRFFPAVEQLVNLDVRDGKPTAALQRAQQAVESAPTNAAAQLLLARVHLSQTNVPAAEQVLEKALTLSPDAASLNALLAQVYVLGKKQQEALKRLEANVARNTNDLTSWLMVAQLHSAMSNQTASVQAYETVLAQDPRNTVALNNLAWLYAEELNNLPRAFELASKARELQPQDPASADTFGWVLFKRGDYPRALSILQESASSRELADNPDVRFHLGMTHYMMGEEAAARVALQDAVQGAVGQPAWKVQALERLKFLDFDPAKAEPDAIRELETAAARAPDPIALSRLAAAAERAGEWQKALATYEKALLLNSNLAPVLVKVAQIYAGPAKNPERAFALARRAQSLSRNDPQVTATLGRLAFQAARTAADFQWAHGLLQESLRQLPAEAELHLDAALAAYAVGDTEKAVTTMAQAIELKPANDRLPEATQFLALIRAWSDPVLAEKSESLASTTLASRPDSVPALMLSGLILERKGEAAKAAQAYESALKIYPLFAPATKALAMLYASKLKDPARAFDYASKAREAMPQDAAVARVLGELTYQRGDLPRAVQLLRECLPAQAADPELHYLIGLAQYKLKQPREAREALTKALGLSTNSPSAAEAIRVLAELK